MAYKHNEKVRLIVLYQMSRKEGAHDILKNMCVRSSCAPFLCLFNTFVAKNLVPGLKLLPKGTQATAQVVKNPFFNATARAVIQYLE